MSITRGEEGSRASTVRAENMLKLRALDAEHTEVRYASELSLVGRLGKFGFGVMKKKAQVLGANFADAFRARVEAVQAG